MLEVMMDYVFPAIGIASAAVALLDAVAKVTPSTKDDEYASKAKKVLGHISEILSKLALNPKK